MMKYLLVEDERFAYEEMKRMMEKLRPDYQLEAWTATVEQTVQFLKHHPVDLMLLDIRLTDGNSFDIFEQIQVTTPVIFTTAYDEHAIQAFKVNSVDYLLKPVEEDDLLAALRKFEQFRVVQSPVTNYRKLEEALMSNCKKNRFLIQKGDAYHYVETSDIAFFYSEEKDEDQGVLFVNVSTAPGSSLKTTDDVMLRIEERLEALPQKLHIQKVTGYGLLSGQGNTFGMIVVKLKPWDERTKKEDQVQAVIGQIYARTADIKDATIFAIAPGMIPGYGMGNALDLNVQDKLGTDVNTFFQTTQQYLGALNQRPEISMAYSTFDVRYPQWTVEVDAAKCKRAGITPDAVLSTLSGYYGGQYVSNFNRFSKVYRVMIQSGPEYRMDETSLHNTFVRMANGEMAPLSQFVTLTRSYGAETLSRFNMYNSIAVNAMPAEGYSTGDAIRAVKETAEISLPKGYGYDFGGYPATPLQAEHHRCLLKKPTSPRL